MPTFCDSPLVSVVMPAYNCADTIDMALDSLSKQDLGQFEVIVVDDGSSDATVHKARVWCARDGRFRLLEQEHASAGAARNAGMGIARGRYLMFLDADDSFEPTLLSTLHAAAIASGAEVCMCAADCFTHNPSKPVRPWTAGPAEFAEGLYRVEHILGRLYQGTTVVVWDKLFDANFIRSRVLRFQDQQRFNDAYFTILALAHAKTLCKISDVLVHYRIGSGASLVDRLAETPYCDLDAFDAARTALAAEGLLEGSLLQSFDNLCINTIVWRLARMAQHNSAATQALFNAYFCAYEPQWGLTHVRWPYIRSARYAIERTLIKRAGPEGLMRAVAKDSRDRTSGRNVVAEARFIARLAKEALPYKKG